MMFPYVSIIIPTYNRPEMLAAALASVAAQSWRDFEVIVVNDAGEDVTPVLAQFGDIAIVYVRHAHNRGLAAARNTGIQEAKGTFLAFLDDDDVFYPRHLERLVAVAADDMGPTVVYADSLQAYQRCVDGEWRVEKRLLRHSVSYERTRLLIDNHIAVLCVLAHREVFETVGGFDESLPVYEDWDMWLRASARYSFVHLPEVTSEYRLRPSTDRMSVRDRNRFLPYRFLLWRRHSFWPATVIRACAYFAKRLLYKLMVPAAVRETAMIVRLPTAETAPVAERTP